MNRFGTGSLTRSSLAGPRGSARARGRRQGGGPPVRPAGSIRADRRATLRGWTRPAPAAPTGTRPRTRTGCGGTPTRSPPTTSSSSAAAGTGSRPPTTWRGTTASPNVAVSSAAGWPAGTSPATPTIIRSNYLWDESAAIYEHSLKLWEALDEELDYDLLFSQRGVINLAHTLQRRPRGPAARPRQPAQRHRRRVARARRRRASSARSSTSRPTSATRSSARRYQPRGGIARHDHVAWGYARAADALGVDLIQGCEVTGHRASTAAGSTGVETSRGRIARRARSRSSPPATPRSLAGDGRHPAADPEPPAPGARVGAARAGPSDRSSCRTRSTSTSARRTRASWSWAPASTPTTRYAQRGSFHVIEHQMAAALELFPIFARAHVLRTWAGIVDVAPDASPIIGLTPVDGPVPQLRLGHRRLQGDARRRAGSCAHTIAHGAPHELDRAVRARPLHDRRADRRARRRRRWRTDAARSACPWCGPRDETEFRYGGQAGIALPGRPGRARPTRSGPTTCSCATTRRGRSRERWVPRGRLPALVRRRSATRDQRDPAVRARARARERRRRLPTAGGDRSVATDRLHVRRRALTGLRRRHARLRAAGERRRRRGARASTAAGRAASMTAGAEEPNALVQVDGRRRVRADAPGDAGRARGRAARASRCAGKGRLVDGADAGRYDKRYAHCDVARRRRPGPAGLAAAAAARAGDAWSSCVDDGSGHRRRAAARRAERRCGCCRRTTALGVYDHGYVTAVERRPTARTEGRLWHIRAGRIVLATGAIERPIVFADNDRPGIMLAGAARDLPRAVRRPAGRPRRRLHDQRHDRRRSPRRSRRPAIEIVADRRRPAGRRASSTPTATTAGRLAPVDDRRVDGDRPDRRGATCCSSPAAGTRTSHLWSQARGTLRFDDRIAAFVPDRPGPYGGASRRSGRRPGDIGGPRRRSRRVWVVPPPGDGPAATTPGRPTSSTSSATRPSPTSAGRSAPGCARSSTSSATRRSAPAADQGKTVGRDRVGDRGGAPRPGRRRGRRARRSGRRTSRSRFALLAGRDRGDLFDPIRSTPIHAWHVAHGAVFENVGQWKRPRYFPRGGESMDEAVLRECARRPRGRRDDGRLDARQDRRPGPGRRRSSSTASTRTRSRRSRSGRAATALMCRLDGMVFDDGVTSAARRGPVPHDDDDRQRGARSSTTSRSGSRPSGRTCASARRRSPSSGRRSRSSGRGRATCSRRWRPDLDARQRGVPVHDLARRGRSPGSPARVFRISFSGELAYEVNVAGAGTASRSGRRSWPPARRSASRRTAPRRCTSCAPRRATRSSARRPTAPSRRRTSGWTGWSRRRRTSSAGARTRRPDSAAAGPQAARRPAAGRPRRARCPEGAQLVAPTPTSRDRRSRCSGHVTSSLPQRGARADVRAGAGRGRPRADRRDGARAAGRPRSSRRRSPSPSLFDPENRRRDGEPAA